MRLHNILRCAGGTAALIALALSPLGAQTPALQQTPGSQIAVTSCDAHRHDISQRHGWIDPYGIYHPAAMDFPYEDAFLAITYKNTAQVAATEIDFGLVARSSLVAVAKDVGTFSTGAVIDHEFSISRQVLPLGTAFPYCAVLRVKYADGRVWTNPNPPEI